MTQCTQLSALTFERLGLGSGTSGWPRLKPLRNGVSDWLGGRVAPVRPGQIKLGAKVVNREIREAYMIPYYRGYHFRKFPHRSKCYMHDKLSTKMFLRTQKWQPVVGSWTSKGRNRYVYPVNELLSIRRTLGLDEWFRFHDYTNYRREVLKWPWAIWRPKTRALYLKQGRLA